MRQFEPVFTVHGLPDLVLGRFRIQDEPIEVKNERFYPQDCSACHSRQLYLRAWRAILFTFHYRAAANREETPMEDLYYADYIELDQVLNSQHPKSFESLEAGNDEMLFIIIHQVYELWFKQIIFELDLVRHIFIQDGINDNSDDMNKVVHKLKRIGKILELINQQVSVLETMTALDFLEFRNHLLPASGFQSKQFRLIEAKLGLKMEQRYKTEYYKHTRRGSLSESDLQEVNQAEGESTLKGLIVQWLERMPFFDEEYWRDYVRSSPVDKLSSEGNADGKHRFWVDYRDAYQTSLSESERGRLTEFD